MQRYQVTIIDRNAHSGAGAIVAQQEHTWLSPQLAVFAVYGDYANGHPLAPGMDIDIIVMNMSVPSPNQKQRHRSSYEEHG